MLTENQQSLVYWINERESIRLKKEAGEPKPWSADPIMQQVYFCNIDREDDRVTRYIRQYITYEQYADYTDLLMIIARVFNLPRTINILLECIDREASYSDAMYEFEDICASEQFDGEKLWNGAYIISTNGKKMAKLDYCFNLFLRCQEEINNTDMSLLTTCSDYWYFLQKIDGLGSFLAAQIVADLKNTKGHRLYAAEDKERFCAPGPGSLRGLAWFFQDKVTEKNFQPMINLAYDTLLFELPDDILNKLDMQNLQNCFCEYDKFMRVKNKTGRSKRKYNGEK